MRQWSTVTVLILGLFGVLFVPASADPQKWALVIGVNAYASDYPQLHYAVSDATHVFHTLIDPNIEGVPPDHAVLLTTDSSVPDQRPTCENIKRCLTEMAGHVGPNDQIWIFFSGHGQDFDGVSYLCPTDTAISSPDTTMVSTKYIRQTLNTLCPKTAQKILVIDACHSGSARKLVLVPAETTDDVANFVTIAACDVNQCAYEDPSYGGIFTYYLIRGLSGDAHHANTADADIRASDLRDFVIPAVQAKVKQVAMDVQSPQFIPHELQARSTGDLVLGHMSSVPAPTPNGETPIHLAPVKPLGPAIVVTIQEERQPLDGPKITSELAETTVKHDLLLRNFPLVDRAAAQQLRNAVDPQSVGPLIGKVHAGYLLTGTATTTSASIIEGFVTVNATITAQLIDDQGVVIAAETVNSKPAIAVMESQAAGKALKDAADQLVAVMASHIQDALNGH